MVQISDSEYKKFSEQLAQRFERKVKGFDIPTSLQDVPFGVRIAPQPTAECVKNIDSSTIRNNEIYFYTPSLRQAVYNLLRHFRNCGSHKDSIKKENKDGIWYYQFEDKGILKGVPYISLRGNVRCDVWDAFIEDLYATVLKEKQVKKKKRK